MTTDNASQAKAGWALLNSVSPRLHPMEEDNYLATSRKTKQIAVILRDKGEHYVTIKESIQEESE